MLKRAWVEQELGAGNAALQRQLRALLDPAEVLNPGKAL